MGSPTAARSRGCSIALHLWDETHEMRWTVNTRFSMLLFSLVSI